MRQVQIVVYPSRCVGSTFADGIVFRSLGLWNLACRAVVEQRGARLKRFVRSIVCWRPYHDGWEPPAKPGAPRVWNGKRRYESCAMMQLMRACCSNEEMWAEGAIVNDPSCLSRSERRMLQTGRTTLLKIDRGNGSRLAPLAEEVIDLTWDD